MHTVSDKLTLLQFADDSSFFKSGRSLPELFNVLQNEIVKTREWLNNNKLSLNISKTNYMIMTNRKKVQQNDDFQLSIDGHTISQVNETKCFGVINDDRMTFKSHIEHIAGKMSKGVGTICKARNLLPQYSLKAIYRAIVEPYMTYCIELWGHTYGTYSNQLFMLQKKKLMRLINYSEYDRHIRPVYLKYSNYYLSNNSMNIVWQYLFTKVSITSYHIHSLITSHLLCLLEMETV